MNKLITIRKTPKRLFVFWAAFLTFSSPVCGVDHNEIMRINNEAVKALNVSNFTEAISLLEKALTLEPRYSLARENLAIAHTQYGLTIADSSEALKHFHAARILKNDFDKSLENMDKRIRELGKDPNSFWDRAKLGNDAFSRNDLVDAYVEYSAALDLKFDKAIQMRRKKSGLALLRKYPYLLDCVETDNDKHPPKKK